MTPTIGLRLLAAGRIARETLGDALSSSTSERICEAEALYRLGVDPRVIAPKADDSWTRSLRELEPDRRAALARLLPAEFARRTLVLPVSFADGLMVCAMPYESTEHLIAEAVHLARRPVRPVCASVPALLEAFGALYGEVPLPASRTAFAFAGRSSFQNADDALTNQRPDRPALPGGRSPSGTYEPVAAAQPARSHTEAEAMERWDVGTTAEPPRRASASTSVRKPLSNTRRRYERDVRPVHLPHEDVAAALSAVRGANTRERVVETLLNAALVHARQAFCFRLRDGRLEGMDSAGSSLGALAVRRIVLPVSPGSTLHQVLMDGRPHYGALFAGATDQVLKAAIGSRGGRVSMHGIWIEGRPVALLVADDVRTGEAGHDRLGALAHAAGSALRRLLLDRS